MPDLRHVLITGLTRTGSTFLIALYHRLGYNTGFPDKHVDRLMAPIHRSHGGLESSRTTEVHKRKEVRIIKHPWTSDEKAPWRWESIRALTFTHKILTVRDPNAMLKSQMKRYDMIKYSRSGIEAREAYEEGAKLHLINSQKELESWLGEYIEVEFPRSVKDVDYLWEKLEPTMQETTKKQFYGAWQGLANSEYVSYD